MIPEHQSISQHVEQLLRKHPIVLIALARGILNVRATARWLIDEHELNVTVDSVVNGIRRADLDDVPDQPWHVAFDAGFNRALVMVTEAAKNLHEDEQERARTHQEASS